MFQIASYRTQQLGSNQEVDQVERLYAMPISRVLSQSYVGIRLTCVQWHVLHLCRVIINTSCNCLLPCKVK
jgi:hypothetical protein